MAQKSFETLFQKIAVEQSYTMEQLSEFLVLARHEDWEVCEQVFISALDSGEDEIAKFCLSLIAKKFTVASTRVKRLYGLYFEAIGKTADALENYDRLTQSDPTDTFAMKRKVANMKTKGDIKGAIALLNEYLTVFMADVEGWGELADLYTELQMYDEAIFCYEELLISSPQNYHYVTRYAELLFSAGRVLDAAQYYSLSIELNVNENVRALYGLILALSSLKKSELSAEKSAALIATKGRLEKLYTDKSSTTHLDLLKPCLAKLGQ